MQENNPQILTDLGIEAPADAIGPSMQ